MHYKISSRSHFQLTFVFISLTCKSEKMGLDARKQTAKSCSLGGKVRPSSSTHYSMRMVSHNVVFLWIKALCSNESNGEVVTKIFPALQSTKCLRPSATFRGSFQVKAVSPQQINHHEAVERCQENVYRQKNT